MAEHINSIDYKFKINEKDFDYKESFSSYKISDLQQLTLQLGNILQDKIFIEDQISTNFDDEDAFDYISQFNLLFSVYKNHNKESVSQLYKATERLRETIYQEKIHISLLNHYEILDKIDSEITGDNQDVFYDLFNSIKNSFEDNSLSLKDLVTRISKNNYPDDFIPTLNAINKILNENSNIETDDKYSIYRKIDAELYKYVKTKPLLLSKVIYAKKVLNHLTTTKSYLNKYIAAICGTNRVPQSTNTTYGYLFNKIQTNITKKLSALNISTIPSPILTNLLNTKSISSFFNIRKPKQLACVSFLIDSKQNYYSFNGNDYSQIKFEDLKNNFDMILAGENFKYAQLRDETRSFYKIKENEKPYWRNINLVGSPDFFITFSKNKNNDRVFTCCERKILSAYGYIKSHKYHFLITFSPCENCQEAIKYAIKNYNAKFDISYFDKNSGKLVKFLPAYFK